MEKLISLTTTSEQVRCGSSMYKMYMYTIYLHVQSGLLVRISWIQNLIQLFTIMRIRIQLLYFNADPDPAHQGDANLSLRPWPTDPPGLHFEPPRLHFGVHGSKAPEFWLECGSGSSFSLWCGSGFQKQCRSMRIRIRNDAIYYNVQRTRYILAVDT